MSMNLGCYIEDPVTKSRSEISLRQTPTHITIKILDMPDHPSVGDWDTGYIGAEPYLGRYCDWLIEKLINRIPTYHEWIETQKGSSRYLAVHSSYEELIQDEENYLADEINTIQRDVKNAELYGNKIIWIAH